MIKDSRSYETQIIDAVRSVNRALGGTYGTSSAIYRNEFNQYEVQLIDAIKGIARTLSGSGLSLAGGGSADLAGYVTQKDFQSLSARVTKLESESFFRLVDGNVTLKDGYSNLWVPGFLAAGGVGTGGGGGGGATLLSQLEDVSIDTTTLADGHVLTWDASAGTAGLWVNKPASGGGGSGSVTSVAMSVPTGLVVTGSPVTSNGTLVLSYASGYSIPLTNDVSKGVTAYGWGDHAQAGYATQSWVQQQGYLVSGSLYTLRTAVSNTAANGTLLGVDALSNASSSAAGSDTSRIAWDSANSAWHVYGNLYADGWIASGGVGSGGGGGGSSNLYQLDDVSLSSLSSNQFLYYDNGYWKNTSLKTINNNSIIGSGNITISGGGGGSVTSVALAVPTGLSVSGSPITSSGTITISFASGYSIPTNTKQGQWDTAYSNNHTHSNKSVLDGITSTQVTNWDADHTLLTGSQAKNKVFASPANASGAPSFRALVFADIPDLSSKYVTLDTTQTISGAKTFSTNPVTIDSTSYLSVNSSSHIDIGDARLEYDSGSYALRITKRSGTSQTIGLYADGFVAAGGVAASASRNIVYTDGDQDINGEKTFNDTFRAYGLIEAHDYAYFFDGISVSNDVSASTFGGYVQIYKDSQGYIQVTGPSNDKLYLQRSTQDLVICPSTNHCVIGTYTSPGTYKLYVNGTALATSWNTSSDRRLKDDIEDLTPEYAIAKLMALRPSVWTWNSGLAQGKRSSGFIAQDVEAVIPYMVSGEDYKSMNYQMLHAYEVSAIQSHERRIAELERENEMLKERLNAVR